MLVAAGIDDQGPKISAKRSVKNFDAVDQQMIGTAFPCPALNHRENALVGLE